MSAGRSRLEIIARRLRGCRPRPNPPKPRPTSELQPQGVSALRQSCAPRTISGTPSRVLRRRSVSAPRHRGSKTRPTSSNRGWGTVPTTSRWLGVRTPESAMMNAWRPARTGRVPMTAAQMSQILARTDPVPMTAAQMSQILARTDPVPMTAARTSEMIRGRELAGMKTSLLRTKQYETTPGSGTVGTSPVLAADLSTAPPFGGRTLSTFSDAALLPGGDHRHLHRHRRDRELRVLHTCQRAGRLHGESLTAAPKLDRFAHDPGICGRHDVTARIDECLQRADCQPRPCGSRRLTDHEPAPRSCAPAGAQCDSGGRRR